MGFLSALKKSFQSNNTQPPKKKADSNKNQGNASRSPKAKSPAQAPQTDRWGTSANEMGQRRSSATPTPSKPIPIAGAPRHHRSRPKPSSQTSQESGNSQTLLRYFLTGSSNAEGAQKSSAASTSSNRSGSSLLFPISGCNSVKSRRSNTKN